MKQYFVIGADLEAQGDLTKIGDVWHLSGDQKFEVSVVNVTETGGTIHSDSDSPKQVFFVGDGKTLWIWLEGRTFRIQFIDSRKAHLKGSEALDAKVRAPMTGTIVEIVVKEGDEVRQGDLLLKMEAMKMEYALKAPVSGCVLSICCNEGQVVDADSVLVDVQGK